MAQEKLTKTKMKEKIQKMFKKLKPDNLEGLEDILKAVKRFGLDKDSLIEDKILPLEIYKSFSHELKDAIDSDDDEDDDEEIDIVEDDDEPKTFDSYWKKLPSGDKRELARGILGKIFVRGRLKTDTKAQGYALFKITNPSLKTLNLLTHELKGQDDEVMGALADELVSSGNIASVKTAKEILSQWRLYSDRIGSDPTTEGVPDGVAHCTSSLLPECYSLYYSPYKPDKDIPFPNIQATLNRMTEPKAYAAFIWGVYSRRYKGRQICWVAGEAKGGEEGKSYFTRFIGRNLFGENLGYKAISNTQIKGGSVFATHAYVGAALVVYPDCNNRHLLKNELMKSLSGGGRDPTQTEEKFKMSQTSTLDARFIVNSNWLPSVVRARWYLSRLLLNQISELTDVKDPNIDIKYLQELNGFLAYAEECYNEVCLDDETITMTETTTKFINGLLDLEDPLMADVFTRYFELSPTTTLASSSVLFKDIKNIIQISEDDKSKDTFKSFKDYLVALPGVEIRKRSNGFAFEGIALKKATPKGLAKETFDDTDDLDLI